MEALRHLAAPGVSVWSDPRAPLADGDLLAGGTVTGVGPSAPAWAQAAQLAGRLAGVHAESGGTDGFVQVPPGTRPDAANLMPGLPFSVPGLAAAQELAFHGVAVAVGPVFTPAELRQAAEAYRRGLERRLAAGREAGGPAVVWLPIAAIEAYASSVMEGVGAALAVLVYLESFRLRADAAWRRMGAVPPRPGFCQVPAGRLDDLSLPGAILALPPGTLAALHAPLPQSEPDETEAAWTWRQARERGLDPVAMARALR